MDSGPARMDALARSAFRPIYPAIAGQIKAKTGITGGVCLDLGSGPGSMAIAVAKISDLMIYALDSSARSAAIARENIAAAGLSRRIVAVTGDAGSLPFRDEAADLVVSRGSVFFWEDKARAFREVYRVLKPGGYGYIGGGMGNAGIRAGIKEERHMGKVACGRLPKPRITREEMEETLACAGIQRYEIRSDDSGFWVIIRR